MSRMNFRSEADFRISVQAIVAAQTARIATLLPGVQIEHIGSTSIPGALTKGDVDLLAIVPDRSGFTQATTALGAIFEINQPENWTATFASFKDDHAFSLPFGVQVIVAGSSDYDFITFRERLRSDAAAREEYNALKQHHQGSTESDYRQAKGDFIERLLAPRTF